MRVDPSDGNRIALATVIWHKTAVPIFIERFILPAFAALVILLAVTNPMGLDKTQRILGSFVVIAMAYLCAHSIYKKTLPLPLPTPAPLYSVDVVQALTVPLFGNQYLWVVNEKAKKGVPIDLFILLRIVNIQSTEASLDTLKLDVEGYNGQWIPLTFIGTTGEKIVIGRSMTDNWDMKIDPPDLYEVAYQPLSAGKTVRATTLCEVPGGQSVVKLEHGTVRFRITLRDTANRMFTEELTVNPYAGFAQSEMSTLATGHTPTDLSQYQIKRVVQ
jgi:hypothetical protein